MSDSTQRSRNLAVVSKTCSFQIVLQLLPTQTRLTRQLQTRQPGAVGIELVALELGRRGPVELNSSLRRLNSQLRPPNSRSNLQNAQQLLNLKDPPGPGEGWPGPARAAAGHPAAGAAGCPAWPRAPQHTSPLGHKVSKKRTAWGQASRRDTQLSRKPASRSKPFGPSCEDVARAYPSRGVGEPWQLGNSCIEVETCFRLPRLSPAGEASLLRGADSPERIRSPR